MRLDWSLPLSVRTKESTSLKTGSIPVGTVLVAEVMAQHFFQRFIKHIADLFARFRNDIIYSFFPRSLSALVTTKTELSDMAKLPTMGDNKRP